MKNPTNTIERFKIVFVAITIIVFMLPVSGCSNLKKLTGKSSAPENSGSNSNQSPINKAEKTSSNSNSVSKRTPNPSKTTPPPPEFMKLDIFETEKFYQTSSSSESNPKIGYVKSARYWYVYSDGRFEKIHKYNYDVYLAIEEYASPEKAQSVVKNKLAKAVPAAQGDKIKLPRCVGEKSDNDNFVGPEKIMKRLRHPNGSEVTVVHSGDFNNWDCKRSSNRTETIIWADGVYVFLIEALPQSEVQEGAPGSTGYGIAEEFALDYLAALKQPVTQQ